MSQVCATKLVFITRLCDKSMFRRRYDFTFHSHLFLESNIERLDAKRSTLRATQNLQLIHVYIFVVQSLQCQIVRESISHASQMTLQEKLNRMVKHNGKMEPRLIYTSMVLATLTLILKLERIYVQYAESLSVKMSLLLLK